MTQVKPIGTMIPWACSYSNSSGARIGITLYGTSRQMVLDNNRDLRDLTVDGIMHATYEWDEPIEHVDPFPPLASQEELDEEAAASRDALTYTVLIATFVAVLLGLKAVGFY